MADLRFSDYLDFEVETRVIGSDRWFRAFCVLFSPSVNMKERISRSVEGEFESQEEAHEAALQLAKELVDLMHKEPIDAR